MRSSCGLDLDKNDEAIYYNESLFPEFFEAAKQRLLPDGKLVVIFSNLAQITKATTDHPIEKELAKGLDHFRFLPIFFLSLPHALSANWNLGWIFIRGLINKNYFYCISDIAFTVYIFIAGRPGTIVGLQRKSLKPSKGRI